ncbi:uncharacterized protein BDV17DRAFT_286631 [Aspergillus undulatus]|uniref:uncharacterized protein n=1 Tax=Aspergillus undulatus TaxID=1810928 RepID=UPI003CCCDD24
MSQSQRTHSNPAEPSSPWTKNSRDSLWFLRNTFSHLSWPQFHEMRLMTNRTRSGIELEYARIKAEKVQDRNKHRHGYGYGQTAIQVKDQAVRTPKTTAKRPALPSPQSSDQRPFKHPKTSKDSQNAVTGSPGSSRDSDGVQKQGRYCGESLFRYSPSDSEEGTGFSTAKLRNRTVLTPLSQKTMSVATKHSSIKSAGSAPSTPVRPNRTANRNSSGNLGVNRSYQHANKTKSPIAPPPRDVPANAPEQIQEQTPPASQEADVSETTTAAPEQLPVTWSLHSAIQGLLPQARALQDMHINATAAPNSASCNPSITAMLQKAENEAIRDHCKARIAAIEKAREAKGLLKRAEKLEEHTRSIRELRETFERSQGLKLSDAIDLVMVLGRDVGSENAFGGQTPLGRTS